MNKNLIIVGLGLVSVGLAVELKNLRDDFKVLLENHNRKQGILEDIEPILIDVMFEDRMRYEER